MQFPFESTEIKTIAVRFPCPFCDIEVHSGEIFLHGANYAASTNEDSLVCEDYDAICDDCENQFYFSVCIGKESSFIETEPDDNIENLRVDIISDNEFDEYHKEQYDAISANKHLFKTFKTSINNLQKLNEVDLKNKDLNAVLKLQIYSGIISAMETFLSDTMIN